MTAIPFKFSVGDNVALDGHPEYPYVILELKYDGSIKYLIARKAQLGSEWVAESRLSVLR